MIVTVMNIKRIPIIRKISWTHDLLLQRASKITFTILLIEKRNQRAKENLFQHCYIKEKVNMYSHKRKENMQTSYPFSKRFENFSVTNATHNSIVHSEPQLTNKN